MTSPERSSTLYSSTSTSITNPPTQYPSASSTSSSSPSPSLSTLAAQPEYTSRICAEFVELLEKGQQQFAGLRDLATHGKQWETYFQNTFEIFTKLWKFQQTHRQVLENYYGLKRGDIGDIASKIAQLYYHYYLRTSETNYLRESFTFYEAIRSRSYFREIINSKTFVPSLPSKF